MNSLMETLALRRIYSLNNLILPTKLSFAIYFNIPQSSKLLLFKKKFFSNKIQSWNEKIVKNAFEILTNTWSYLAYSLDSNIPKKNTNLKIYDLKYSYYIIFKINA